MTTAALRKLLEGATPGPWVADVEQPGDAVVWGPERDQFLMNIGTGRREDGTARMSPVEERKLAVGAVAFDVDGHNALLIAAAVNALPLLLDVAEAAEEVCGVQRSNGRLDPLRAALAALREPTP